MRSAGLEAVQAINQRPGPTRCSPGVMLFGQRTKFDGEIYANGEGLYHPDADDTCTVLGCRLQHHLTAKRAAEKLHAKDLWRRTTAAQTRKVENTCIGDVAYFYRCYPGPKTRKLQAQRGNCLGAGVVIGRQVTWLPRNASEVWLLTETLR